MSILDQHWFSNITRPSRYLPNEINSIKKDPLRIEVSIALVFPDVHEVGMSHLGLKILYHILNNCHWLAAERAFSPWIDLERELRRHKILLTTLESGRSLSSFDIVGFSLQHELSYTNILNILDLAGIPLFSSQRDYEDPLIIAGGPACFNPEPVADFFDLIVIGDGEEATLEICRTVREAKRKSQKNKKDLLFQLAGVRGVYVPSFFKTHYGPEGLIDAIEPLVSGYSIIEKAVVPDIDAYPFPDCQVVPFTESIHDRLAIELFRGCTRGCRFCQAGMIYRPVRERAPESVLDKTERGLRLTGYEDLTLLSLSSGDYSCIEPLLKALMNRHSREHIAISLPSLRIDSLSVFLMDQIKRVRKTGFTLAPEAGSDRLRRIINKGLTQKDIIETSRAVYGSGWNLIKLYFMIGLPWEEEEDLHDIISLAKEILSLSGKRGNRNSLNVSVSTFVPKSHTPFMWCSQIPLEESQRRIRLIRDGLKGGPVRVKWNQSELSWLEGIFSRGDRRLSRVVFEAWKLGARFDGWGERFKMEIWEEAFRRAVVDPCFYLHRERTPDEVMPWDHIRSGVTKAFHKSEWEKAQNRELSPDCRGECLGCGVCDNKGIGPVLYKQSDFTPILDKPPLKKTIASSKKYRLTFTKLKDARFLGHLELLRVFIMAFNRAELDLVYSKGFHPKPKISFACALPVGTESVQETVNIELVEASNLFSLNTRINRQLPPGIIVTSIKDISFDRKGGKVKESRFLIAVRGVEIKKEALERFFETDYFPVVKVSKKGEYEINARSLVKSMSFIPPGMIKLTVRHTSGPELRPAEIVKSVFSLNDLSLNNMKILKTRQTLI